MKLFEYISEKDFLNLKPGDKLLVNKDLKAIEGQYHIPYGYVSPMSEFEGEIVTVRELVSSKDDTTEGPFVVLEEDDGVHAWAPECFKCKVEQPFPSSSLAPTLSAIFSSISKKWGTYSPAQKQAIAEYFAGERHSLSTEKLPDNAATLPKVLNDISKKWGSLTDTERNAIAEYFSGERPALFADFPPDDTATIGCYCFYYTPDNKIICKEETTGCTTTARCHEDDIFSIEVGQLVSFAHMLGYDVDHCGNNDRFSLIKKKPTYYYGEKVLVDTSHPDCPKAMKENYKDEIGIILSYSLDRKANTYIYKVVFKDEKIYKLQENVLKNVPINFIPGAQDLKDTYVKVKKK